MSGQEQAAGTRRPVFRVLERAEIDRILRRNTVARLAYSFRDRVDITPIHYVYADGWIYGRTAPGTKLLTLAHNPWVAFETDEVESLFRWRSVVVKGRVYVLDEDASAEVYERALARLRALIPEALTADDPTPARTMVFRISIDEAEGRAAEME
jgi:nitroimidazol reductase NimA-like FMN-containing flavoprotein (pyridoxamine 5'-phosphate oxidase superfamily)